MHLILETGHDCFILVGAGEDFHIVVGILDPWCHKVKGIMDPRVKLDNRREDSYFVCNSTVVSLLFTHFYNPIFILSTIAIFFLNNEKYGYIILLSHYLGNFIIGILLKNKSSNYDKNYTKEKYFCQNFSTTLINSIKSSIDTLLLILGTLTSFLIVSSFITNFLNLSLYQSAILKGILEITMGLKELSLLNISDIYKVVISTIFISFGGLSVHLQVISQIAGTNIKYTNFLIARIYHAIISGSICFLLFKIL